MKITKPQLQTPEGSSIGTGKEKVTPNRDEQWSELAKGSGSGAGQAKTPEEILTTIPLWVKLPNLSLNCWNAVVLSKIGSSLGKPLYADECTS
ncbi:hypothetical protein RDI58_013251 [Solanum bulbocastanum]|uniref:DUF4283 domain-containing protein n=1 Tax=Solanum bulbocastanum TaxID=147425 RepID=A0AAN8TPV1_SOLBU